MRQFYMEIRVVDGKDLSVRAYILFYLEGRRVREYSGKTLGLPIYPNKCKTLLERSKELAKLKKAFKKALADGSYAALPKVRDREQTPAKETIQSAAEVLTAVLKRKKDSPLSNTYKRDLTYIHDQFLAFLTDAEKCVSLGQISAHRIEEFLQRFTSSNKHYMNKRTALGVLFATAGKLLGKQEGILTVQKTESRRPESKGNVAYTKSQVKALLDYLELKHPSLYICAVLTYATSLRPHVEIRQLRKHHFSREYSVITLQGSENKGKRMRTVYVPWYAQEALKERLDTLGPDQNIFSGKLEGAVNADYFKTAWNRIRPELLKKKLIREGQTIYSFRHTAAVQMYRKAKDIRLLQQLMGHQSVTVTENYLRSLGEVDMETMKAFAPKL